jgi:hypothetical protein
MFLPRRDPASVDKETAVLKYTTLPIHQDEGWQHAAARGALRKFPVIGITIAANGAGPAK